MSERLAVIADIHGNLLALEAVLADIAARGITRVVNLGDCVAGPLWPAETFARLATLNLPTVRGNHDRWVVERAPEALPPAGRFAHGALNEAQRAVLHALPATLELAPDLLAVHGIPTDDSTYLLEEQMADGRLLPAARALVGERLGAAMARGAVLCGHSHRQALVQVPAGPLVLNPGSVGCPAFADVPAAMTLEPRSPHARYAVLTRRAEGGFEADMIALAYDWNAAARRADSLGFPAWARMLATGHAA